MPFALLRFLDSALGKALFFILVPLANFAGLFFSKNTGTPRNITVLKLHGGGSVLVAMPALLGIRTRYPGATLTLIGTAETGKFAELTGVFSRVRCLDASSLKTLAATGFAALAASFRQDIVIDLEPHSNLAPLFTALTLASHRIGFVKAGQSYRAQSYTTPIYFNLNAPVYAFYDQAAEVIGATPASMESCRSMLSASVADAESSLPLTTARPVVYVSAFTSSLSPERMLPDALWIEQLRQSYGDNKKMTILLGGSTAEAERGETLAAALRAAFPLATVMMKCGTQSLRAAAADILAADAFWGVDSGPLHIARLLGKPCTSFWGPSNPATRLRPAGLDETVHYRALPCSPCVHLTAQSPCRGDNQCMKKLFTRDVPPPITRF